LKDFGVGKGFQEAKGEAKPRRKKLDTIKKPTAIHKRRQCHRFSLPCDKYSGFSTADVRLR
jgi:hypothetical protein